MIQELSQTELSGWNVSPKALAIVDGFMESLSSLEDAEVSLEDLLDAATLFFGTTLSHVDNALEIEVVASECYRKMLALAGVAVELKRKQKEAAVPTIPYS